MRSREKEDVGIRVKGRAVFRKRHEEGKLLSGGVSREIRLNRTRQARRQWWRGCLDTDSVVDLFQQFNAPAGVRPVGDDGELFRSASVSEEGANGCDLLGQSVFSGVSKNVKGKFARN